MGTYDPVSCGATAEEVEAAYRNNMPGELVKPVDIYRLKLRPDVTDGKIRLQIREIEPEESHFDRARLVKVVHAQGTLAFADRSDIRVAKLTEVLPSSCENNAGQDCVPVILKNDGQALEEDDGAEIVVTFAFEKVPAEAYLKISSWGKDYVPEPINPKPLEAEAAPSLLTSYWKDGQWVTLDKHFQPRTIKSDEYKALDLRALVDAENALKIKLTWTDRHSVDKVSIVTAQAQPYDREELALTEARHSRLGDVLALMKDKDYEYADIVRGDVIALAYEEGDLVAEQGEVTDYFFISEGYYHGVRTELHPDVDLSNSYLEEIAGYVKELEKVMSDK